MIAFEPSREPEPTVVHALESRRPSTLVRAARPSKGVRKRQGKALNRFEQDREETLHRLAELSAFRNGWRRR
jgi:hypothetical protein